MEYKILTTILIVASIIVGLSLLMFLILMFNFMYKLIKNKTNPERLKVVRKELSESKLHISLRGIMTGFTFVMIVSAYVMYRYIIF